MLSASLHTRSLHSYSVFHAEQLIEIAIEIYNKAGEVRRDYFYRGM